MKRLLQAGAVTDIVFFRQTNTQNNISIMKKVFLTAIFAVCAMAASAQLYVGGGLGFSKEDNNGAKTTEWSIRPEIGYTVNDNWAFGVALGYTDVKDQQSTFSVEPYARWTFFRADALSIFADGAVSIDRVKPEVGESTTGWGIAVKPGVAYAINENFSVVAHVGALGYWDRDNDIKEYGVSFDSTDLSFSLYYSF